MVSTFALVVSYSSKRIRVEAPVVYLVVCRVSALVVGYSLVKTSSSSNIDRLINTCVGVVHTSHAPESFRSP